MTLNEAIKHCADIASDRQTGCNCAAQHIQLMEWLKELKTLRRKQLLNGEGETEKLLVELGDVYDDIQSALQCCSQNDEYSKDMRDGIALIGKSLLKIFDARGYRKIPCSPGDKFDPHYHEALYATEKAGRPPHEIYEIARTGWTLDGKVVVPVGVFVTR